MFDRDGHSWKEVFLHPGQVKETLCALKAPASQKTPEEFLVPACARLSDKRPACMAALIESTRLAVATIDPVANADHVSQRHNFALHAVYFAGFGKNACKGCSLC